MKVLLISDPNADNAAAALDVHAGSFLDPKEWEGLAHFLEHMLFLGTKKFPEESEYNKYLAQHGGGSNAFTSETDTCYFFQVAASAFPGALDRFAQFFLEPLLTESATEREVNAVNSEHSKNILEDIWRDFQLMRTTIFPPGHPGHHFSTGNLETLGGIPREVLLKFHSDYYSAKIMTLAVLGREDLGELEKMVRGLFSGVVSHDVVIPQGEGIGGSTRCENDRVSLIVNPEILTKTVFSVPVKEVRKANFDFYLPEQRGLWKSKPARFLSHVFGHEAENSLLARLKRLNIATDLSAGPAYDSAGVCVFRIGAHLTESAAKKESEISGSVTSVIAESIAVLVRLLGTSPLPEYLIKDVTLVDTMNFKFKPNTDPASAAQNAAAGLQNFPPENVLSGSELTFDWDHEIFLHNLGLVNFQNSTLRLVGKEFSENCQQKEKWYGIKFGVQETSESVSSAFQTIHQMTASDFRAHADSIAVGLPAENPFIAERLEIKSVSDPEHAKVALAKPPVLVQSGSVALLHDIDQVFNLPNAAISLNAFSPWLASSCLKAVSADLLVAASSESLNEKIGYAAAQAGLKYSVSVGSDCLTMTCSGYDDKLPVLTRTVAEEISRSKPSASVAARVIERSRRNLRNQLTQKVPYEQAADLINRATMVPYYSATERLAAVELVGSDPDRYLSEALGIFSGTQVEALAEGNITAGEAKEVVQDLGKILGVKNENQTVTARSSGANFESLLSVWPVLNKSRREISITRPGCNPAETNGAVVTCIQMGFLADRASASSNDDMELGANSMIASQIVGQKFFDELRTKQQLGYIVNAHNAVRGRAAVMNFIVQSEVPVEEVKKRISDFIDSLPEIIQTFSDDDFGNYIAATAKTLEDKPHSITDRFNRHWSEVSSRRFDFNRRARLAERVRETTRADFLEFVREKIVNAVRLHAAIRGAAENGLPVDGLDDEALKGLRKDERVEWVSTNRNAIEISLRS